MFQLCSVFLALLVVLCCGDEHTSLDNDTSLTIESSTRDQGVRRLKEKPSLLHHPAFLLDRYPGDPSLPSPDGKGPHCRRKAKCEHMNISTCLGAKLPYASTTLDLVGMTQDQMQEKLQFWTALKHVPRCWAVIQPFICALYMPRCDNDMVDLPSQEMCKMALSPCRILELERGWTSPFRCDDTNRFPPMCKNDGREVRFNTTAECLAPLVPTDNPSAFYEGTEGCGVQCANPMFTKDEHRQIQELIAWAGSVCAAVNLFTVATFLIDWRSANKYPALIIFYINCCFFVVCIGFLAQFLPGAREGIVCRKDGTLRMSEPSAGENLSCVIVFVLIYYSLMAACVWFVILAYAWHLSFQALGKIQDRIDKKGAYFHLVAWSLPLVLTITTMAVGEIDANSELGICFVGYLNPAARGGLLLGPVAVLFSAGVYFILRGLITLVKVKINSHEIISERASAKMRETIVRMGFFTLFTFIFVVATFVVHIYEFQHRKAWKESFRTFMICKIMRSGGVLTDGVGLTGHGDCRMEVRPSLAMVQLHLLALFTAGVVMSSWVWTSSTVDTWFRFLKRSFNQDDNEGVKMKKHKVIAQVFAKRQAFNRAGRISISFHSTHDDPVGLNFELNSVASVYSSAWAAALPNFVTRRGALIDPATGSISSQHSDVSGLLRAAYGIEHRRHSLESQLSAGLGGRVKPRHKRKKHQVKRSRIGLYSRRGSTTSQESQLGHQILSTLAMGNPNISSLVPNLKRRTGNAGLNDDQLLPNTLSTNFRILDQSDITDDEGLAAGIVGGNLTFVKNEDMKNNVAALIEPKNPLESNYNFNGKASLNSQDKTDKDFNEVDGRNSNSSEAQIHSKNGVISRNSSPDSKCSLSPKKTLDMKAEETDRIVNGSVKGRSRKSLDKLSTEGVDKVMLLNSRESKREGGTKTKTYHGKTYIKVKTDCPMKSTCSGDDASSSSNEDCDTLKVLKRSKTSSPFHSFEVAKGFKTLGSNDSINICIEEEVSLSRSLNKHISVGTQTSLSSGLNEIESINSEKLKFITPTQTSHHLITSIMKSGSIHLDSSNTVSHNSHNREARLSRSNSSDLVKVRHPTEADSNSNIS